MTDWQRTMSATISSRACCYVASDDLGAILEMVGPDLLPGGCAPASLLAGRHLRRLAVSQAMRLADTLASRAAQWVTAEIATITPYTVPQAWARTFRGARWSGVRYAIRHSTSRTRTSYALFGPAGERRRWRRGLDGPAHGVRSAYRPAARDDPQ
jgi:hypothetical protein